MTIDLQKLYQTNDVIDTMKETLIALEPELAKKSIAVAELMKNLAKEQKSADKVRVTVKGDEETAKVCTIHLKPNPFLQYVIAFSRLRQMKLKC